MKDLDGRVAVVTGAASGIGRALAERFAAEGMRLVLADVEAEPLAATADALRQAGADVETSTADVSRPEALEELADLCQSRFDGAHVLCNNAGVAVGGLSWEVAPEDWDWILGVNLVGVVNGIRAFVPRMIAAGQEGYVVNTASIAGLTAPALMSPYNATKHAVVALSETLLADLRLSGAPIGVSVLCPGWVRTRIHEADRNKPGANVAEEPPNPDQEAAREMLGSLINGGMAPEDVAMRVLEAIREDRFWIRTHEDMEPMVRERCEAIIKGETPQLMAPTDIR